MAHELLEYIHTLKEKLNENEIKTILDGIKNVKDEAIVPESNTLVLDVEYVEAFVEEDEDYDEDPETKTGITLELKKKKATCLFNISEYNLSMLSVIPNGWIMIGYSPCGATKILRRCSCGCASDYDEINTGSHTVDIKFPEGGFVITNYRVVGKLIN